MPLSESSPGLDRSYGDSEWPSSSRSKNPNKSSMKKLSRQVSVEGDKRREMLKQESKDSGIVTEMSVRPKDSAQKDLQRSESMNTKARRSIKSKSEKSDKMKRSQSVKEKRKDKEPGKERSHDDLEVIKRFVLYCVFAVVSGT